MLPLLAFLALLLPRDTHADVYARVRKLSVATALPT